MRSILLTEGETVHSTEYLDYDSSVKLSLIFGAIILYIIVRVWLSIRKDNRKKSNKAQL